MIQTLAMWLAIFIAFRGAVTLAIDIRRGKYSEHSKYLLRCLGIDDPERDGALKNVKPGKGAH